MSALTVAALAVVFAATVADAAYCNMKSNTTGPQNTFPIDTDAPVFVRRVPNGELYTVGKAGVNLAQVLHLYGKHGYDFGFAQGSLIPVEVHDTIYTMYGYFTSQILQAINSTVNKYRIPQKLVDMVIDKGVDFMLDWQFNEARPYMNSAIEDEMHGLADATGIPYAMLTRIHMVGEITKGACSFYGLSKTATAGGKTLQLRALDWDTSAGLQNHPTITIYHPESEAMGYGFANVGWAGWLGVLTGMSANQIGISEIGISYPDKTFGDESYIGEPFVFLERHVVQHTKSVFAAMDYIKGANRTCHLVLGVADAKAETARMVQYSHSKVAIFDSTDLEPLAWWHPRIADAVYCAMDWICPYYQHVMADQLTAMHGRITPELSISNITAVVQTGSLHVAVMDLTDQILYVANARGTQDDSGSLHAYARHFIRLDAGKAFAKKYGDSV
jgi:hypothetical protein